jgi:hypothetical protein
LNFAFAGSADQDLRLPAALSRAGAAQVRQYGGTVTNTLVPG